jgi:uncharacterized protein (TIGR04552 family)
VRGEPQGRHVTAGPLRLEDLDVGDLEVVRLLLRGGSVVDWRRLHFRDAAEVDHFLALNLVDLSDPRDERRVRAILSQAVDYLRSAHGYRVAAGVAEPADLRHLFLLASGVAEPRRHRRIACVVLKCMHVVHHLEARELLFRTALREADLSERVHRRVMAVVGGLAEEGFPVDELQGNMKTRHSLVTKLLVKRESQAAQVFDRVRYRLVTRTREDVAPLLSHLSRSLFPFNYVVPGQTQNTLLEFRQVMAAHPHADRIAGLLHLPPDHESRGRGQRNPFSDPSYRALNFVVDLPVRIDDLLPPPAPGAEDLGRVVFAMVEFQVLDAGSARENEAGPARHALYKKRQLAKVLRRLSRGLVVPRRARKRPGAGR